MWVLDPLTIALIFAGILIGTFVGAVPGLGSKIALTILIPFTGHLEPYAALAMYLCVSEAASFGDTIPAVLFRTPGTAGAAATAIDGYALCQKGKAGYALGAGAMAEALRDGTIEGTILTMELAKQVAMTRPLKPLPWDEATLDKFIQENPVYGKYVYPPNTFKGVDFPILTMDNGVQLICPVDMDEELVYKLAKAISENLDCMARIYAPAKALTPQWVASELANPFHPGSIKYFKEKGLWK